MNFGKSGSRLVVARGSWISWIARFDTLFLFQVHDLIHSGVLDMREYDKLPKKAKGYRKKDMSGRDPGYHPTFSGANKEDVESLRAYAFGYGFRKSELIQAIYYNIHCGNLYYTHSHWRCRYRRLYHEGSKRAAEVVKPFEKFALPVPCPATNEQAKALTVVSQGLGMTLATFWSSLADAFENDSIVLRENEWYFCQDYVVGTDSNGKVWVRLRREDG